MKGYDLEMMEGDTLDTLLVALYDFREWLKESARYKDIDRLDACFKEAGVTIHE